MQVPGPSGPFVSEAGCQNYVLVELAKKTKDSSFCEKINESVYIMAGSVMQQSGNTYSDTLKESCLKSVE